MKDIIKTVNTKKVCPDGDVPVKLIKMNEQIFSRLIFQNFKQSLVNIEFPHCLKQDEVIPVFKIKEKLHKAINRPVNFSPVISKIYERLMYDQMFNILIKSSLNFNVVFLKDLALRNCLLYVIKNWKESLDQEGHYDALLTDFLKAFDCMIYDLFLVKLQAYGFDNDFLNLICNYLLDRTQRTKIKLSLSTWSKIEYGILCGFILGPLFFNINTLGTFFDEKDVNCGGYTGDNAPHFFIKTLKYFSVSFRYVH